MYSYLLTGGTAPPLAGGRTNQEPPSGTGGAEPAVCNLSLPVAPVQELSVQSAGGPAGGPLPGPRQPASGDRGVHEGPPEGLRAVCGGRRPLRRSP